MNKCYNIKMDEIFLEDCVNGMRQRIEDESVDLVIADPPYFKVIGEKWDYLWRTEDDYLDWSKKWINEASRTLRKGGSFYLFGYFRMLSRLLPIVEANGLEVRQQIIINKGKQAISGRATKNYRIFPNVTESILFLEKDPKPYVKEFLKSRQKTLGLKAKEINEALGVKSNGGGMWSIYTGKNVCKQLPTKELWDKLQNILDFKMPYEKISQTFNPEMGTTDVWDDISFYGERNRFHPTQKPLKLIHRLVATSSNVGDMVMDPFMGSGTTAIACMTNGRHFVGFEVEEKYYSKSLLRIQETKAQESLLPNFFQ